MFWGIIFLEGVVKIMGANELFRGKRIQRNKRASGNVHVGRAEGMRGTSRGERSREQRGRAPCRHRSQNLGLTTRRERDF